MAITAFRLGTIYKTAKDLLEEEDLQYLEKNNYFLYGFIPPEDDTTVLNDSLIKAGEIKFKQLWMVEDTILKHRYNIKNWWYQKYLSKDLIKESEFSGQPVHPDLLDPLDILTWMSSLDRFKLSVLSNLSVLPNSLTLDLKTLSNFPYPLYRLNHTNNLDRVYRSDYTRYYKRKFITTNRNGTI